MAELVQLLQSLTDSPLGVCGRRSVIGSVCASPLVELIVPGVHVVGNDTASTTPGVDVAYVSTVTVARIANLPDALPVLTTDLPVALLASSLWAVTLFSALCLTALTSLTRLARLAALS